MARPKAKTATKRKDERPRGQVLRLPLDLFEMLEEERQKIIESNEGFDVTFPKIVEKVLRDWVTERRAS